MSSTFSSIVVYPAHVISSLNVERLSNLFAQAHSLRYILLDAEQKSVVGQFLLAHFGKHID